MTFTHALPIARQGPGQAAARHASASDIAPRLEEDSNRPRNLPRAQPLHHYHWPFAATCPSQVAPLCHDQPRCCHHVHQEQQLKLHHHRKTAPPR
eukprot:2588013-Rhodomonas_salina.2